MRVSYHFDKREVRREFETFCKVCKKKLRRVLKEEYYLNGFHDEEQTRKKLNTQIEKDMKKIQKQGVMCKSCNK